MKVLLLGSFDSPANQILRDAGEDVLVSSQRIDTDYIQENGVEFIVSHGYGYILGTDILDLLPRRAINL